MAGNVLVRRRDRAQQLHTAIAKLERAIADDAKAAAQSRQLAQEREQLVDELAGREAAGTITAVDVDARLDEIERDTAALERNAQARGRALALRERELQELRDELEGLEAVAAFDRQLDELKKAVALRTAAEAEFVEGIRQLVAAATRANESLAAEAGARELLEDARPDGEERDVASSDAPEWPEVRELISFLERGPRQPARAAQLSARRSAAASATARRRGIGDAVRLYASRNPVDVAQLRGLGFGDEAIAAVTAEHERLVRQHAEREADPDLSRIP